ncbi:hypothetical protein FPANT_151 [Fusarium pseudoanthophilum]|uniref:Uncharacterized protein n=1 Tax=Fusarium pseudoanthophilum TaxID=48495 RepID=A0A8H5V4X9_9HYPO|nr:hypothetical protein FPANT_151 [Fusarium pseudoanthophilum]
MSDFRTRIPCREIDSLSKLYDVLTNEYGNMYYKLETEKNEQGELFWVVGVSSHFARDVRELLITKGVLRRSERPRGFTAINGTKAHGDSLPEVVDLTGDDADEETPQALGNPNTADATGSGQYLPDKQKAPAYVPDSVPTNENSPEKTPRDAVTRIAEQDDGAEQRPTETCNSAVGQGDRPTARIPISMLLGEAQTRA